MIKLYTSAKHPRFWIAYVPGSGWTMFPAQEGGWDKREPARGLDPMHVREVALQLAAKTGLIEEMQVSMRHAGVRAPRFPGQAARTWSTKGTISAG